MVNLDSEGEPIVTITESMDERFPLANRCLSPKRRIMYARWIRSTGRLKRTPQAVKVKIDYMKDGRTDRYWLPLEIGAGGSFWNRCRPISVHTKTGRHG